MRNPAFRDGAVLLLVLVSCVGPTAAQPVTGRMAGTWPDLSCAEPLGPADGELFALEMSAPPPLWYETDIRAFHVNGTLARHPVDWKPSGYFQVPRASSGGTLLTWVTHYSASDPPGEHHGVVAFDAISSWYACSFGETRAQHVPAPAVAVDPRGNRLSWTALPVRGADGACNLGDMPWPVPGYNVYRLLESIVPPATSTPRHYLCGPDLDCLTTANNGWVAFVPGAPGADGLVRFQDVPLGAAAAAARYVIQPVLWGHPEATSGIPDDSDADTIPDEDLDGDTIPEFVDPSGMGRGLTGRVPNGAGGFTKPILISSDSSDMDGGDAWLFLDKRAGGSITASWRELGVPARHRLHAQDLDTLPSPDRIVLECDLPPGPASTPLVDPAGAGRDRAYLLTTLRPAGEWYGTDSFATPRPPTPGTPCP